MLTLNKFTYKKLKLYIQKNIPPVFVFKHYVCGENKIPSEICLLNISKDIQGETQDWIQRL